MTWSIGSISSKFVIAVCLQRKSSLHIFTPIIKRIVRGICSYEASTFTWIFSLFLYFCWFSEFTIQVNWKGAELFGPVLSIACPDFQPAFYSRAELRMVACSYKVFWNTATTTHLHIVFGCFVITTAVLSSSDRDKMTAKSNSFRKSVLSSDLGERCLLVWGSHNQSKGGWKGKEIYLLCLCLAYYLMPSWVWSETFFTVCWLIMQTWEEDNQSVGSY